MTEARQFTDDMAEMLKVLPDEIVQPLIEANHFDDLLEVVLDLGRFPTARFVDREI